MSLFTYFNVATRKFKSMTVACIGDLYYISNRQYWTRVFPVHETSDMEREDSENHLSK